MPNGNIVHYIEDHPESDRLPLVRSLTASAIVILIKIPKLAQSASGLCYLHEHNPGLIHGDIKGVRHSVFVIN
jgi:hypothetical protein